MTPTDIGLLIGLLLAFFGACYFAVRYWDESDHHDATHTALATSEFANNAKDATISAQSGTIASQDQRLATTKKLNEHLLAELTKTRTDLAKVKQQAHILGHHIADTHWLPTIEGNRRRPVDIRAALVESAPVYEATEAFVPRMSTQAYAAQVGLRSVE